MPTPPSAAEVAVPSAGWMSDEYFLPGGAAGIVTPGFPYTPKALRMLFNYRSRARLAGVPSYAPFYAADHPSGAFTVTTAILAAAHDEASARRQAPVLVALPDYQDAKAAMEGEAPPYQPLVDALSRRGIETPNVLEAMVGFLGDDLVAQVIEGWIAGQELLPPE